MKQLLNFLLLLSITTTAQVKGNKNMITKNFPFQNVHTIKIDLHADITIDMSQQASLTITTDSNLFKYIDTEIVEGTIHFSQLKWIEASSGINIKIGTPLLTRIIHDTHNTTNVINVNTNQLSINASIGHVIIKGKTNTLRVSSENANINASHLEAKKVYVNLWNWGTIIVSPREYLWADVSNEGTLFYTQLPIKHKINTKSGGIATNISNKNKPLKVKWIHLKIKNNSNNRNHFIVNGPKSDGSIFGYGFPMMPYTKRKEKWSVGTKVYQETKLGLKKLLVTIKTEDEGKTVSLFN